MGIPSYFAHLVRRHRNIIKTYKPGFTDNLYLDCNSVIYDVVHQGTNDKTDKIIAAVCAKIAYYIKFIQPKQRVLIAFDGVAPVAKMEQQRARRYVAQIQSQTQEHGAQQSTFNTAAITPGTEFMAELARGVKAYFQKPLEKNSALQIMVSVADEVGEGEHKIYEYIRANPEYHKQTCTIVYGLDADLIMLTLNHLHISDHIYLFRETPEFIKSLDRTLNPHEHYLLDIPELFAVLTQDLSFSLTNETKKITKCFDYIFMCFMLGNDFLPHFPALNIRTNGIDKLQNAYKHVFATSAEPELLINADQQILWKNVRIFINHLSTLELQYIQEEDVQRERLSRRTYKDDAEEQLNLPLWSRDTELFINPHKPRWEERYYLALFGVQITDALRREICVNYLEGLEWNLKYYSKSCVDWRWQYKYNYPPLLKDLVRFIPVDPKAFFFPVKPPNPVSALTQLSYVLPQVNLHLIPCKELREGLIRDHPAWYKYSGRFQWAYCKFFWEAHAELPPINIAALETYALTKQFAMMK
jgi:5'-3' exonuclease